MFKKYRVWLPAAIFSLVGILFCTSSASAKGANAPAEYLPAASAPIIADIEDTGDFKVGFAPGGKRRKHAALAADDRAALQEIADQLNKTFALPENIYLVTDNCGEANAFYDPNNRQLKLCNELYTELDELFKDDYPTTAERENAVNDAVTFVFFHELGHAFIDVYGLPVAGNEEDAVDQLSTFILIDGSKAGAATALHGAMQFALAGDDETDSAFEDEHSLNSQRFDNIVCLVYGENPTLHADFLSDGLVPKKRATQCSNEYKKVEKTWSRLLAPFIKD